MADSKHHHNEEAHDHDHSHGHDHHHHSHTTSDTKSLGLVIAITGSYMVVELIVGFYANSLALIGDALHMLTDVSALALAAFTLWLAKRPANDRFTYGYSRAESIGAFANSMFLLFLTTLVLWSAIGRLREPELVGSRETLIAGIGGLLANLLSAYILHRNGKQGLAMRGALLHVLSDALGSIGVIIAALVIAHTGWLWADPIASIFISILISVGALRLLKDSILQLMDEKPRHLDTHAIEQSLKEVAGVTAVHDVHIWSHSQGKALMTAHLVIPEGPTHQKLCEVQDLLAKRFHIHHSTIQIEQSDLKDACRE